MVRVYHTPSALGRLVCPQYSSAISSRLTGEQQTAGQYALRFGSISKLLIACLAAGEKIESLS
jgi:hypothetical protein